MILLTSNSSMYIFPYVLSEKSFSINVVDIKFDQPFLPTAGISAGSITILIICFFIIWQSHKRKYSPTFLSRNTSSDPSSKSELEITGAYFGIPIFPYTELEEATNYFDPDREIGDGGFGTVYHGKVMDNCDSVNNSPNH